MPRSTLHLLQALLLMLGIRAFAQDFRIDTQPPRLFLQPRKLALLQKEKDRQSIRWQQVESLFRRPQSLAEPGLAKALYAQVTGDPAPCREAALWGLEHQQDLRQLALIFDWCQEKIPEAQSAALLQVLARGLPPDVPPSGLMAARDRLLAALAVSSRQPQLAEHQLRLLLSSWWESGALPYLLGGGRLLPPEQLLALAEFLHAARDNLRLDLRRSAVSYFQDLPLTVLLAYYPVPHSANGMEMLLPARKGGAQPAVDDAVIARAAALCLVSFDASSRGAQFLQGFLMQDRFLMRDPRGAIYEFLWANPYQPGLSFHHAPLFFHNRALGALLLRSSWNEDAVWMGYFENELQVFDSRGLQIGVPKPTSKPFVLGPAAVYLVSGDPPGKIQPPDVDSVFLVGLKPETDYLVDLEGAKRRTETSDRAGILAISLDDRRHAWLRIRPARLP